MQMEVYRHYREGQCDDKKPSNEWILAAQLAIYTVAVGEQKMSQIAADTAIGKLIQLLSKEES